MIITKYYHIAIRVLHLITKLMSVMFEDQGEGGVMVKLPNIWYLRKAPTVLWTGHPDCGMYSLREIHKHLGSQEAKLEQILHIVIIFHTQYYCFTVFLVK